MRGALQGLAEGLDADSAWLTPAQVGVVSQAQAPAKGTVGLELTRQYYLRVIAARDGSPAAKAGLATGDYIRAINGAPTRELSVWAGDQALRGAPGSKVTLTVLRGNAAEPHEVTLVREEAPAATVTSRLVRPGVGLLRVAAFTDRTAGELRQQAICPAQAGRLAPGGRLRRTAEGAPALGFASARLFVATGTLGAREGRTVPKQVTAAASGDGIITLPITLLADNGTSQAAEVFAAALKGNKRATIVGERTLGRAASQELVKLPDGSGLWLSTARFIDARRHVDSRERASRPTPPWPSPISSSARRPARPIRFSTRRSNCSPPLPPPDARDHAEKREMTRACRLTAI